MFNNQRTHHPYQPVPHCDSGDEIELEQPQTNNKITNLLKLTAHRRIRQHSLSNSQTESTVITIDNDLEDIDLNATHADTDSDTQSEGETLDFSKFNDTVFLLYLDGTKKRVGVLHNWRIWDLKVKYFSQNLSNSDNVRLIYRGKLLTDSKLITEYNIPSDGFIHVSISKNKLFTNPNGITSQNFENNTEDINYDNFDDGMDDEAMARMLQQREMSLVNGNGMNARNGSNAYEYGVDEERDRNRARREFLCGMFLGSVAGIWTLVFLILSQRGGGYSRRFRLGVTIGVAINLMVQISYQYPNVNGGDGTGEVDEVGGEGASEVDGSSVAQEGGVTDA